jgi:GT2 family glycosyltransferase
MLRDEFPDVCALVLPRNEGFAVAVNAGILAARGDIIVLMNNDVEAAPHWLSSLVDALERHPEAGACASKMLSYADPGVIDSAGDRFGLLATSIGHGMPDGPAFDEPSYVFSACAGAAAYRRVVLERVGTFDERFFAYLEDVDLGARIQLAGWQCLYVPEAVVHHHGSATARRMPALKITLLMRNSLFLFFQYMPARTLGVWGPVMLAWPLYRAFRERRPHLAVKALAGFVRGLPAVLHRRREIARTRRLSPADFRARLSGRAFGGRPGRLPLLHDEPTPGAAR